MIKPPDTQIAPQWVTVKEELLDDFFDLANNLANWKTIPTNGGLIDKLSSSMMSLYLKVRRKIKEKEEFKDLVKDIDSIIKENKNPSYNELIKCSMDLLDYIESTGITNVSTSKLDPITDFIDKSFA